MGKRSKTEDQQRRQRNKNQRASDNHRSREEHIAGAADDRSERIEQPKRNRAGEHDRGVRGCRGERSVTATHQRIELGSEQKRGDGGERTQSYCYSDGGPNQFVGTITLTRAQGARNGRQNAASHRARRYHLQQHEEGEHQRYAGEGVEPKLRDEIGFDQANRGLHHHDHDIRKSQTQDRAGDRRLQQYSGSRVHGSALSAYLTKQCICTFQLTLIRVYAHISKSNRRHFRNASHAKTYGADRWRRSDAMQLLGAPSGRAPHQSALRPASGGGRSAHHAIFDLVEAEPVWARCRSAN